MAGNVVNVNRRALWQSTQVPIGNYVSENSKQRAANSGRGAIRSSHERHGHASVIVRLSLSSPFFSQRLLALLHATPPTRPPPRLRPPMTTVPSASHVQVKVLYPN